MNHSARLSLKAVAYTLLACIGISTSAFAQLPDECDDAADIGCGSSVSGNLASATSDVVGCGIGTSGPSLWYRITGDNKQFVLTTCDLASFDTRITVFEGECGGLTCVASNDQGYGCADDGATVSFVGESGSDYFVMVDAPNGSPGAFDLELTCTSASEPENNDPESAAMLDFSSPMSGSLIAATASAGYDCSGDELPGVWFLFEGNGDDVALDLCATEDDFDSYLEVYDGSTCVVSNDNMCGNHAGLVFSSTSSTEYRIHVAIKAGVPGNFTLTAVSSSSAPSNDTRCGAIALSDGVPMSFDNSFATIESGELGGGTGSGANSCQSQDGWCSTDPNAQKTLWYSFTAPTSGAVEIELSDDRDFQIAVWTMAYCDDPMSSATLVRANDENGDAMGAKIRTLSCLSSGTTYYVQVDGHSGAFGEGTIELNAITLNALSLDLPSNTHRAIGIEELEFETFVRAQADNGLAPYTYAWSGSNIVGATNKASLQVNPSTTGSHTYTVTITDAQCATVTASGTVFVEDIDCSTGGDGSKVQVHTQKKRKNGTIQYTNHCLDKADFMRDRYRVSDAYFLGNGGNDGQGVGAIQKIVFEESICKDSTNALYERDLDVGVGDVTYISPYQRFWKTITVAGVLQLDGRAPDYRCVKLNLLPGGSIVAVGDGCPDVLCCAFDGPPQGGSNKVAGSIVTQNVGINNGDMDAYRSGNALVDGQVTLVGNGGAKIMPQYLDDNIKIEPDCVPCTNADYAGELVEATIVLCTDSNPSVHGLFVQDMVSLDTLLWIEPGQLDTACHCYTFEMCLPDSTCLDFFFTDSIPGFDTCAVDSISRRYMVAFGDTTYYSPSGGTFFGGYHESLLINCPTGGPGAKRRSPNALAAAREGEAIRIMPNPAKENTNVFVSVPVDEELVQVELLNIAGQQMQSLFSGPMAAGDVVTIPLETAELPNGLYLVRTTINGNSELKKLVVNH